MKSTFTKAACTGLIFGLILSAAACNTNSSAASSAQTQSSDGSSSSAAPKEEKASESSEAASKEEKASESSDAVSKEEKVSESSDDAAYDDDMYNIGICQYSQYPADEEAVKGFEKALTKEYGDKVNFDLRIANEDQEECEDIITDFVDAGADLILADGSVSLKTAADITDTIPVVGTCLGDFSTALGMTDGWNGTTKRNISGISDLQPLDKIVTLMGDLLPEYNNAAFIYRKNDSDSKYSADQLRKYLDKKSIVCNFYTYTDDSDILQAVSQASQDNDILYLASDSIALAVADDIDKICQENKNLVITQDSFLCSACGDVCMTPYYLKLGNMAGKMAISVLNGDKEIGKLEIQYPTYYTKMYMEDRCSMLGITVPKNYIAIDPEE